MNNLKIGGEYISDPYFMHSGQDEAMSRRYYKYTGKSGRIWLVANQLNAADNIYVSGNANSDGFGGATLNFSIVDDTILSLRGPWHSNSSAFLNDVGIDITDKHLTWGCIGTGRKYKDNRPIITNLIWFDELPIVGKFDRVTNLAQILSDEYKQTLYYFVKSTGGSSCGPVNFNKFGESQ